MTAIFNVQQREAEAQHYRDCHASLAMTRGKGLAMTRRVIAAVKNTGKTRYNS